MSWQQDLLKKCKEIDIEPVGEENKIILLCSNVPDSDTQKEIINMIPSEQGYTCEFKESPKQSTLQQITQIMSNVMGPVAMMMGGLKLSLDKKHLKVEINIELTDNLQLWEQFDELLKKDKFFESWEFVVMGKQVHSYNQLIMEKLNQNFEDTKKFNRYIQEDDILNLKISLGKCETIDEFLQEI